MKTIGRTTVLAALLALLAAPAVADADVFVVHGVPGVAVDVYVNGDGPVLEDFQFGQIEGPLGLPAGTYDIDVYAANADPTVDMPAISGSALLADGQTVALVAHLDENGGLTLSPFGLDGTETERAASRLGVRHTAAAPPVDLIVTSPLIRRDLSLTFGATNGAGASADAPAGPVQVVIALPGTTDPVVPPIALTLRPGVAYYAYAVGSLTGGSFQVLLQTIVTGTEDSGIARPERSLDRLRGRFGF